MKKTLLNTALAAALLAGMGAAQAGTLAMNGWLFGQGNTVHVSTPNYNGAAGGFKGSLSGLSDPKFNVSPVMMYCVDLAEYINIGSTYSVKIDGEAGAADFTIMSASAAFGSSIASRLGQLVSYTANNGAAVDTHGESTSLQLAIWNTVYDTDSTLLGGTFTDTSAFKSYADTLLGASASASITKDLYVMRSVGNPGKQDQLFWIDMPPDGPGGHVPEPASLALVGVALGGLLISRRRRRA